MRLYLRVRGARLIRAVAALTLVVLALPFSALAATPSPAGATLMAGALLALAVPVVVGWGCARGDAMLEAVADRPVRWFDLALALVAGGGVAALALLLNTTGVALSGAVTARALLVFLGLLLGAVPVAGWRLAPVAPSLYVLAVAIFGRGEDIDHPAVWAWIAALPADTLSWVLSGLVLMGGVAAYIALPRRFPSAQEA